MAELLKRTLAALPVACSGGIEGEGYVGGNCCISWESTAVCSDELVEEGSIATAVARKGSNSLQMDRAEARVEQRQVMRSKSSGRGRLLNAILAKDSMAFTSLRNCDSVRLSQNTRAREPRPDCGASQASPGHGKQRGRLKEEAKVHAEPHCRAMMQPRKPNATGVCHKNRVIGQWRIGE